MNSNSRRSKPAGLSNREQCCDEFPRRRQFFGTDDVRAAFVDPKLDLGAQLSEHTLGSLSILQRNPIVNVAPGQKHPQPVQQVRRKAALFGQPKDAAG